jgi:maltooligosyltrehalose trehalohydrolase
VRATHDKRFGTRPLGAGGTAFRLWAPSCAVVKLELIDDDGACISTRTMRRGDDGWHECECADVHAGASYRFRVRDDLAVPDPASRFNPLDVHGPSVVIDPLAYEWRDAAWRGKPWHTAVVYEMHVGTFTPEGRFDSAAEKLADLRELGVTAIELMPVADFSGARNWGYDGVLHFAPDAAYGHPDDLKRFVDRAHRHGLMVMLDVVYNHFGPDGNYLHAYCPEFFNERHVTPWGAAINFDGPSSETVRRFFVDNALAWIEEYRFDGLRLDAVHAIADDSPTHIVAEIAQAVKRGPGRDREVHIVLENEHNDAQILARDSAGVPLLATAQWNDDLHHSAHVVATGETEGYYSDYEQLPPALFGRALAEGFVYQGQHSDRRGGPRGEPSTALPSTAFIAFLQNHDQTGNRAFGERLDALVSAERVECLLACLLLAPQIPLLFMGEEFGASTPFYYFCDAHGELAKAIREGRRSEFAGFAAFDHGEDLSAIPDPNAIETFNASKLDWAERASPIGQHRSHLVKALLQLRAEHLVPLLPLHRGGGDWRMEDGCVVVDWKFGDTSWTMRVNLGDQISVVGRNAAEHQIYASRATQEGVDLCRLLPEGIEVAISRRRDS